MPGFSLGCGKAQQIHFGVLGQEVPVRFGGRLAGEALSGTGKAFGAGAAGRDGLIDMQLIIAVGPVLASAMGTSAGSPEQAQCPAI